MPGYRGTPVKLLCWKSTVSFYCSRRELWRSMIEMYEVGMSADIPNETRVRWRKAGVWDHVLRDIAEAFDGDIVMIDSSCVRVHQHAATGKRGIMTMVAWDVPAAA